MKVKGDELNSEEREAKSDQSHQYEVQGKTLIMKPVTIGQVKALTKILVELEVGKDTKIPELIEDLLGNRLTEMANVLFRGQCAEEIDWGEVDYEITDRMLDDFFVLNPRLKSRLKSLFGSLVQRVGLPIRS